MARQANQVGRNEVDAMDDELRSRLTGEYHAMWRMPGMMELLRRVPYPMDEETAAGVAAVHSDEVISWDDLRVGYAVEWVRDGYLHDGYARGPSLEELEYWTEGSDLSSGEEPTIESLEFEIGSTYGIADVGKKEFEAACDELLDLIRQRPEAASAVMLSLPFGGSRPVAVPLVDGVWVSRWALELHEQRSLLESRGYTLLPPAAADKLACSFALAPFLAGPARCVEYVCRRLALLQQPLALGLQGAGGAYAHALAAKHARAVRQRLLKKGAN